MAIPTMVPINKIRLNTTRSSGIEEPQIGFDTRIVILRSVEIRLHYFDSRMREHVGVEGNGSGGRTVKTFRFSGIFGGGAGRALHCVARNG
jgi:hypothetical protein